MCEAIDLLFGIVSGSDRCVLDQILGVNMLFQGKTQNVQMYYGNTTAIPTKFCTLIILVV